MDRRDALKHLGLTAGAFLLPTCRHRPDRAGSELGADRTARELERIATESPAACRVKVENGAPRLYLNDRPILPLWGMSLGLLETTGSYRASGIDCLSVILGLEDGWSGPGRYDWTRLDAYLASLLARNPAAYFLPRLQLNAPRWWEDAHRDELVRYGLPVRDSENRMPERFTEGGFNWNAGADTVDPSLASAVWIEDTSALLRSYLRHIERSPLSSRMMGYHVVSAMTSEWHYIGSRYLPDYSPAMVRKIGAIPTPEQRMHTTCGLLRDPAKEREVIEFYRRFHQNTAETIVHFAGIVKAETRRRVLCGTFYAYIMENVMIQEAGHLAPETVLTCPDIDYLASPYTYQHSNVPGNGRWESDVIDGAGNRLGRARGEGGDGGYRIPAESVKRHGKLFVVEWDPSTYLEPVKCTEGGSGSRTVDGTRRILQRDMGRMLAGGIGGWFLEFGHMVPPFGAKRGWYDDRPIIDEIRGLADLGRRHLGLNAESLAQAVAVVDADSFRATQHWTAERPWKGFGIAITDFFNHWFVNSQARSFHRIGAPMDFLFRFDLAAADVKRYRLFFLVNAFLLEDAELERLQRLFRGSGVTVVWYYAPGFIAPDRLSLERTQQLTGFHLRMIREPGPMMIRTEPAADGGPAGTSIESRFGAGSDRGPRFAVTDADARVLGRWVDDQGVAFAMRTHDGYNSVYVGTAPLPVGLLRWLAGEASVSLWSDRPDIITATRGATCLVATDGGERLLRCPSPQRMVFDRAEPEKSAEHRLTLALGDVRLFVAD